VAKSRQQRRARRAQQQAAAEPRAVGRARPQREAPAAEPSPREEAPRATGGRGGFVRESWGELKKVDWPDRPQVLTGSIVVIIACAIVGGYLWAVDQAFKNLVEKVLL
jgi:preprotein translocase subunit SecE